MDVYIWTFKVLYTDMGVGISVYDSSVGLIHRNMALVWDVWFRNKKDTGVQLLQIENNSNKWKLVAELGGILTGCLLI